MLYKNNIKEGDFAQPPYRYTLKEWQNLFKLNEELIFNASETTGRDLWIPEFPIGVMVPYEEIFQKYQVGTHENILNCAFKIETDKRRRSSNSVNREIISKNLMKNGIFNKYKDWKSGCSCREWYENLSSYKFVVSPEGNGVDCHRHYEALLFGCIPIIEESEGIREKYGDCPILFTKDYSEITIEYLEQKYSEFFNEKNVYDFSKLFLSSYSSEIKIKIFKNGNHWAFANSHKKVTQWYPDPKKLI